MPESESTESQKSSDFERADEKVKKTGLLVNHSSAVKYDKIGEGMGKALERERRGKMRDGQQTAELLQRYAPKMRSSAHRSVVMGMC